jgi:5'(3')-deoxyribonucleotidase
MDGVIVDFEGYMESTGMTSDQIKTTPGSYLAMKPIPGALSAIRLLIGLGFDVRIATKCPTGESHAYADKVDWVYKYIPELIKKITITHDKGELGDRGDFLCDDRPHKANCEAFSGTLLRFVDGYHWPQALTYFRSLAENKVVCLASNCNGEH